MLSWGSSYQPSTSGFIFSSTFWRPISSSMASIAELKRDREYPVGMIGSSTFSVRGTTLSVVNATTSRFRLVALSRRRSGMPEYVFVNVGGGSIDDIITVANINFACGSKPREVEVQKEQRESQVLADISVILVMAITNGGPQQLPNLIG